MQESGIPICIAGLVIVFSIFCFTSFAQDQDQLLLKATKGGDLKQVQDLLDKGADVNIKGDGDSTPLMCAAFWGYTDVVSLLLEKGADINARDVTGKTALSWVISPGRAHVDMHMMKLLIEKNADLNAKDNEGVTALMRSVSRCKLEVMKLLLDQGADVNAKTNGGDTALMWAVSSVAQMKPSERGHGPKAQPQSPKGLVRERVVAKFTGPSLPTSCNHNPEITKLLLLRGADVNARDDSGYTALNLALHEAPPQIIELLKAHGAKE